jgi:hypothetical protein
MQRIVLSAFVTSSLMIGPALAGPLALNPDVPYGSRQVVRVQMQIQPRPAAPQPAPEAYAARPRPAFGGGFFEALFGGFARSDQRSAYGNQDLGPGMVESPYSPGRPVVDPRYIRQEVAYDGKEAAGTIIVNTNQKMLYLVQANGRAIRYGIGVGRPGFTWAGTHHITSKRECGLEAAAGNAPAPARSAAPYGRRSRQSARRARALSRLDALSHPRLERALDHRHAGVVGLHPDAQRGRGRPLQPGQDRHQGGGDVSAPLKG